MYVPEGSLLDDLDKRAVWGDWYETRQKEKVKKANVW